MSAPAKRAGDSWRDANEDDNDFNDYARECHVQRPRCPKVSQNNNRIEEWLNNKRVVTKNDDAVCWICLRCELVLCQGYRSYVAYRWVKRCVHYPAAVKVQAWWRMIYEQRMVIKRRFLLAFDTNSL